MTNNKTDTKLSKSYKLMYDHSKDKKIKKLILSSLYR